MPRWNRHPWQLAESPYGCPGQWTEGYYGGKIQKLSPAQLPLPKRTVTQSNTGFLEGLQFGSPLWIWKMQRWWHLTHPYLSHPLGLWLSIQKTKIMASGSITSWQIGRQKVEAVTDFTFLGSKITVDSDWSQEIKRHLLLGRKAMTNLHSILKSRGTTLPTKIHIVKAVVFSSSHVWIWELDPKEG